MWILYQKTDKIVSSKSKLQALKHLLRNLWLNVIEPCDLQLFQAALLVSHISSYFYIVAYPSISVIFLMLPLFRSCVTPQRTWEQRTLSSCTPRPLRSKPEEKAVLFGNRMKRKKETSGGVFQRSIRPQQGAEFRASPSTRN